jgi:hypothetical protein
MTSTTIMPATAPTPTPMPIANLDILRIGSRQRYAVTISQPWLREWFLATSFDSRLAFRTIRWMGSHLVYALWLAPDPAAYLRQIGFTETPAELAKTQATMAFKIFPELRG